MAIGAFVPLACFVLILGGVGVRLVALWRRTGEIPEMTLGFGLLIVCSSLPLCAVGRVPAVAMEPIGRICFSAGLVLAAVGISLIVYFNHLVFRRGSSWSWGLMAVVSATMLLAVSYMSVANFRGANVVEIKTAMRPGTLTLIAAVMVCFASGGIESLRCHTAARRRLLLGLSDPIVVNRFLLWGIASAASALLIIVLIGCVLAGMTILREPAPLAALASCGVVMSLTWYLTFFPPAGYLRQVRERALRHISR